MHEIMQTALITKSVGAGTMEAVRAPTTGHSQQSPCDVKRRQLVETEYGLRALGLHLAAVEQELLSLEGFSLTGVLASLRGDRRARIEEARKQVQNVQSKYDATAAAADSLRQEVEALEQRLLAPGEHVAQPAPSAPPGAPIAPPSTCPEAVPAAQVPQTPAGRIKAIQRAIDVCEEARKGLLAEMETASTLGRCNVAAPRGLLNSLVGGARDRTRNMLGQRVRSDLRRFLGRYAEAIAAGSPAIPEEEDLRSKLEHAAEQFSGAWLQPNREANQATDDIIQGLALAEALLEKRLNEAQG